MKIVIHRGTHEIGGSCVEIRSKKSRILIDIGMPLVKKGGDRFNFKEHENTPGPELVRKRCCLILVEFMPGIPIRR